LLTIKFKNPAYLRALCGERDANLTFLEQQLGVSISLHGSTLNIQGVDKLAALTKNVLNELYQSAKKGHDISLQDVESILKLQGSEQSTQEKKDMPDNPNIIITRQRTIKARNPNQQQLIHALNDFPITFATGPAGTGKTYLIVAQAVSKLISGDVDRIILTRPAVEAGERLGFLPGDMKDKVDPYLRPIYDALYDMLPVDQVHRYIENGVIEIAPLAFMRGRTLAHSYIILDEAQNTTQLQMKMCLTRLGEGSQMAITGDLSQTDLPPGVRSGLEEAVRLLTPIHEVALITFTKDDVVRHPLVSKIVEAYENDL
jgi:phosphate starvation-inducible PhoH-like protein